jgi:hypothetical protein
MFGVMRRPWYSACLMDAVMIRYLFHSDSYAFYESTP